MCSGRSASQSRRLPAHGKRRSTRRSGRKRHGACPSAGRGRNPSSDRPGNILASRKRPTGLRTIAARTHRMLVSPRLYPPTRCRSNARITNDARAPSSTSTSLPRGRVATAACAGVSITKGGGRTAPFASDSLAREAVTNRSCRSWGPCWERKPPAPIGDAVRRVGLAVGRSPVPGRRPQSTSRCGSTRQHSREQVTPDRTLGTIAPNASV